MTATKPSQTKAACVFFDGPFPTQNRDGDEIPYWVVGVGDEDGEPLGKLYECYSFDSADDLAKRMARDRRLELVHEANRD